MFHLFVCLFVCLLATSRKKYSLDLYENFTRDVSLDTDLPVNFWKSFSHLLVDPGIL